MFLDSLVKAIIFTCFVALAVSYLVFIYVLNKNAGDKDFGDWVEYTIDRKGGQVFWIAFIAMGFVWMIIDVSPALNKRRRRAKKFNAKNNNKNNNNNDDDDEIY